MLEDIQEFFLNLNIRVYREPGDIVPIAIYYIIYEIQHIFQLKAKFAIRITT